MKANTKYTALEILQAAGIEKPEEKIGKVRVRIAGLAGIVKPDHLIKIQSGTKEFDVIVGEEVKKVAVEGDEVEQAVSEAAKVAIDAKAKVLAKQAEDVAKAKKEAADKKVAEAKTEASANKPA